MEGSISIPRGSSAKATIGSGNEKISTIGSDSDNSDWFAKVAWGLLGKDSGLHLHYATGFPESSCYKYTAKEALSRRQPPGYLVVTTLRAEQGWQWLSAYMQGSDAQWWRDIQRAVRLAEAIDAAE